MSIPSWELLKNVHVQMHHNDEIFVPEKVQMRIWKSFGPKTFR